MPTRKSRSLTIVLRGLRHHLRCWGQDDAPTLFFLHGGRDASITFQFLVDALKQNWRILALDWRGHGQSDWPPGEYWFQDYVADLEALLDHYSPTESVSLVGHSLGGNVALNYAGVRPDRVRSLVSLDAIGLTDRDPETAPMRLQKWMDSLKARPQPRLFSSPAEMADRLRRANPRLAQPYAEYLAANVSRQNADGTFTWAFDPRHRAPFPTVYRFAEWAATFRQIRAPVLLISAELDRTRGISISIEEAESRTKLLANSAHIQLQGVGHNLHHEVPALVAEKIEPFLQTARLPMSDTVAAGSGVLIE